MSQRFLKFSKELQGPALERNNCTSTCGGLTCWEAALQGNAQRSWWRTMVLLLRGPCAGAGSAKDQEDDRGIGASGTGGEAERAGTVRSGEEMAQGVLSLCINT